MGKYTNLESDIFSIFSSSSWKAEKISTYPNNFVVTGNLKEFIRVSIIPSGQGVNRLSVSGVLIIDIFTAAGDGTRKTSLIADTLDQYLVGSVLTTEMGRATQFANSSLSPIGFDKDNPALFRSSYTIPFNFFGVL